MSHQPRVFRVVCLSAMLCFLGSCRPTFDDTEVPDFGPEESESRVPFAPTALGEMPPAILGNGGDLEGEAVNYLDGDLATTGYIAVPEGEGPFPALVVIHEWNGLVDRVRQVADDFAAEGYVTLAADLYQGRTGSGPEENIALMQEAMADMSMVVSNLNAAVSFLKARPDVSGRVGAMGWCFGGGVALSFGLDGDDHDATAIFYGRLIDDPAVLAGMDHEVYGTFAREDNGPSPQQVEAFAVALRSAGIKHDLHIYDEVNHGFWLRVDGDMDARSAAGLDAWERLKAYLDRTLR
ncbi:MAG TPA: dienelactone hydrolase [Gemmatimonadetes bacterium]|nr:dienelactone hydrolase [Gemmatimonadota bacterium]